MLSIFLVYYLWCVLHERIYSRHGDTSSLPYPPKPPGSLPIVGHLLYLGALPFIKFTQWAKHYGEIYQIQFGPRRAVVINGASLIRNTLLHKGLDVAGRPDFHSFQLVNDGQGMIFNSPSKSWNVKRLLMSRAINKYMGNNQKELGRLIYKQMHEIVHELLTSSTGFNNNNNVDRKAIDPTKPIWRHSSTLFHEILLANPNISPEQRNKEINELVNLFESIMHLSPFTMITDLYPSLSIFFRKYLNQFRRINEVIATTMNRQQIESLENYRPEVIRDITDSMIQAYKNTSDDDLTLAGFDGHKGQIKTLQLMGDLIGAGQSTVASSLRWLILHMIIFPDIQERVRAELLSIMGPVDDNNNTAFKSSESHSQEECSSFLLSKDDYVLLPYTAAVILESQRHSCMFPFLVPHCTTKDTDIGGYRVPENTLLFFNIWSASRDKRIWGENVEQFDPKRFFNSATGEIDTELCRNALTFGAGRRRCIGEKMGSTIVFVLFAEILRRCRFSHPPGIPLPSLLGHFGFDHGANPYKVFVDSVK